MNAEKQHRQNQIILWVIGLVVLIGITSIPVINNIKQTNESASVSKHETFKPENSKVLNNQKSKYFEKEMKKYCPKMIGVKPTKVKTTYKNDQYNVFLEFSNSDIQSNSKLRKQLDRNGQLRCIPDIAYSVKSKSSKNQIDNELSIIDSIIEAYGSENMNFFRIDNTEKLAKNFLNKNKSKDTDVTASIYNTVDISQTRTLYELFKTWNDSEFKSTKFQRWLSDQKTSDIIGMEFKVYSVRTIDQDQTVELLNKTIDFDKTSGNIKAKVRYPNHTDLYMVYKDGTWLPDEYANSDDDSSVLYTGEQMEDDDY
jgi:hypothetical protein